MQWNLEVTEVHLAAACRAVGQAILDGHTRDLECALFAYESACRRASFTFLPGFCQVLFGRVMLGALSTRNAEFARIGLAWAKSLRPVVCVRVDKLLVSRAVKHQHCTPIIVALVEYAGGAAPFLTVLRQAQAHAQASADAEDTASTWHALERLVLQSQWSLYRRTWVGAVVVAAFHKSGGPVQ